jgi:hypothetical protein
MQRLKWRPLADRRKDARLVMLYKIDRELIVINKENRLIPPGRKTRQAHNRSFQIPSSRIDTRKMSFWDFQVSTQKAKSFICFAGNRIYVWVPL